MGDSEGEMTDEERWMRRYQEVVEFINANHRNPSKYDDTERGLYYNWLRHNMKLYNSGGMKTERMAQFKQLLELGEKYKRVNQWC